MAIVFWITGLLMSVYISLYVIKRNREVGYTILTVFLAGYILIANILTPRLTTISLGSVGFVIVTGSIIWPFTAQISDMINEVYGKKKTYYAAGLAYIVNLLFVIFVLMAGETKAVWNTDMETFWRDYFMPSGRVFLASSISYIICQLIDINIFSHYKEKFRMRESQSKLAGLIGLSSIRSVLSDMVNLACDAIIFPILAFAFVLPIDSIIDLIFGSILFKVLLSILDTPLFTLFRVKIKEVERQK